MTMYMHLFSIHRLSRDILRGLSPAKLQTLHNGLHTGKYPHAVITHQHKGQQ